MMRSTTLALLLAVGTVAPSAAAPAQAFDASYSARLAGIRVGEARLTGTLAPGPYRVAVSGSYGLLGFGGTFEASAEGRLGRAAAPSRFAARNRGLRDRAVAVTFAGGDAVATRFDPPPDAAADDRVPLDDSHRRGVVDPLSALLAGLVRASGASGPCGGAVRVFTGGARFDIALSPGGAPAQPGPEAETVCAVRYTPIAGHRAGAPPPVSNIKVAFPRAADAAGLRLPLRIEMRTPFGTAVIERTGRT